MAHEECSIKSSADFVQRVSAAEAIVLYQAQQRQNTEKARTISVLLKVRV